MRDSRGGEEGKGGATNLKVGVNALEGGGSVKTLTFEKCEGA